MAGVTSHGKSADPPQGGAGHGRARHALMIEDDHFIAEMYAFRLRLDGWQVDIAATGEEGLEVALKCAPDLFLLDVLLPGIDGVEVLRRLRADERTRDVPALVLSNSPGVADKMEAAKQLGIIGWLTKAVATPDDLVAYLHRVLP